jgi:hypothetical protein
VQIVRHRHPCSRAGFCPLNLESDLKSKGEKVEKLLNNLK